MKEQIEKIFSEFKTFLPYLVNLSPITKECDYEHTGGGCCHFFILFTNGHIFMYDEPSGCFLYSEDKWDSIEEYMSVEQPDDTPKKGGFGWEGIEDDSELNSFSIECNEDDITAEDKLKLSNLVKFCLEVCTPISEEEPLEAIKSKLFQIRLETDRVHAEDIENLCEDSDDVPSWEINGADDSYDVEMNFDTVEQMSSTILELRERGYNL